MAQLAKQPTLLISDSLDPSAFLNVSWGSSLNLAALVIPPLPETSVALAPDPVPDLAESLFEPISYQLSWSDLQNQPQNPASPTSAPSTQSTPTSGGDTSGGGSKHPAFSSDHPSSESDLEFDFDFEADVRLEYPSDGYVTSSDAYTGSEPLSPQEDGNGLTIDCASSTHSSPVWPLPQLKSDESETQISPEQGIASASMTAQPEFVEPADLTFVPVDLPADDPTLPYQELLPSPLSSSSLEGASSAKKARKPRRTKSVSGIAGRKRSRFTAGFESHGDSGDDDEYTEKYGSKPKRPTLSLRRRRPKKPPIPKRITPELVIEPEFDDVCGIGSPLTPSPGSENDESSANEADSDAYMPSSRSNSADVSYPASSFPHADGKARKRARGYSLSDLLTQDGEGGFKGVSQRGKLPLPVPVPNLTKQSRGRKVPRVDIDTVALESGARATFVADPYSIPDCNAGLGAEDVITGMGVGIEEDEEPARVKRPRGRPAKRVGTGLLPGEKDRSYLCQVPGCGKCFVRSEHLKRHVRSIHTYEKPHVCPVLGCGKMFSRRDNLGQHLRIHERGVTA